MRENLNVPDALFCEHGSDESAALLPELSVGGEDGVSQERAGRRVDQLPLSILGELARENGFDVLWIPRNDDGACRPTVAQQHGVLGVPLAEHGIEVLQHAVCCLHIGRLGKKEQDCTKGLARAGTDASVGHVPPKGFPDRMGARVPGLFQPNRHVN